MIKDTTYATEVDGSLEVKRALSLYDRLPVYKHKRSVWETFRPKPGAYMHCGTEIIGNMVYLKLAKLDDILVIASQYKIDRTIERYAVPIYLEFICEYSKILVGRDVDNKIEEVCSRDNIEVVGEPGDFVYERDGNLLRVASLKGKLGAFVSLSSNNRPIKPIVIGLGDYSIQSADGGRASKKSSLIWHNDPHMRVLDGGTIMAYKAKSARDITFANSIYDSIVNIDMDIELRARIVERVQLRREKEDKHIKIGMQAELVRDTWFWNATVEFKGDTRLHNCMFEECEIILNGDAELIECRFDGDCKIVAKKNIDFYNNNVISSITVEEV